MSSYHRHHQRVSSTGVIDGCHRRWKHGWKHGGNTAVKHGKTRVQDHLPRVQDHLPVYRKVVRFVNRKVVRCVISFSSKSVIFCHQKVSFCSTFYKLSQRSARNDLVFDDFDEKVVKMAKMADFKPGFKRGLAKVVENATFCTLQKNHGSRHPGTLRVPSGNLD